MSDFPEPPPSSSIPVDPPSTEDFPFPEVPVLSFLEDNNISSERSLQIKAKTSRTIRLSPLLVSPLSQLKRNSDEIESGNRPRSFNPVLQLSFQRRQEDS